MIEETVNLNKIRFLSIILIGMFFLVGIFLFRWQIVDAKKFDEMATERIRNVKISSLRGSIYASDGSTLAFQERRFDLYAYIPEIERAEKYNKQTRAEFLAKVSEKLGVPQEDLKKQMESGTLWVKIASKLQHQKKQDVITIKRNNSSQGYLEGIFVEYTSQRVYPENQLASHIIGFYADNGSGEEEGRAGIELYWDKSLKAIEGFKSEEVDSFENAIPILDFKPIEEKRGTDIYLTIDPQMQRILEEKLKESIDRFGAEAGGSVLMDPKTGKILAIANYPTYNPNDFKDIKDPEAFNNRSVTVPYEFGSVGKIFTVAAVIEEKKLQADSVILPEGHQGCEFFIESTKPECKLNVNQCRVCTFDKRAQPAMTVADGLIKSDNIAMYHTVDVIGKTTFHKYLEDFRVAKNTGVEIYESEGILNDSENWTIADLVTSSYGHGYQATLLQVTSAVSAIANDGKIMQPYIVEKVVDADGNTNEMKPEVIGQPVSKDTADIVGNILAQVYKNSILENYNKDLLDYSIGMKSGTALIPYKDRAGYSEQINSTHVGFDLSDDKSFILSVWLHKPKVGGLSSQNSRTLWLDTFRGVKDYINVPKSSESNQ